MNLQPSPALDEILRETWDATLAEFEKLGRSGHEEILSNQDCNVAADAEDNAVRSAAGWIMRAAWHLRFEESIPLDVEGKCDEAVQKVAARPSQPEPLVVHLADFLKLRTHLEEYWLPDEDDDEPASEETARRFAEAFERRVRMPGEYGLEEFIEECGISETAAKPIMLDVLARLGQAEAEAAVAPPELADLNRWILYKLVPDKTKVRGSKIPCSPRNGEPMGAIEGNRDQFVTFQEAAAASVKFEMGISFVFLERDGFVGIDLDHAVTDGVIHPEVQNWLKFFSHTYAELSPSGTGVHIIAKGRIGRALGGTPFPNADGVTVEMYADSRHLTFTGNRISTGVNVSDCQIQINKLLEYLGETARGPIAALDKSKKRMKTEAARQLYNDMLTAMRQTPAGGRNAHLNNTCFFASRAFAAGALGSDAKMVKDEIKQAARVAWDGEMEAADLNTFEHSWEDGLRDPLLLVDPPEYSKQLIVCRGSEIALDRVVWLWRPLLALSEINVFAGLPDIGKGAVFANITAAITARRPFYGEESFNHGERDEVLILSGEETYSTTTLPRIKAAEGNLDKVHVISGVKFKRGLAQSERTLQLKRDVETLAEYLAKNVNIILVIIDPVDHYFGGAKKNAAEDVREIYGALKQLAEKFSIAVLLVDHLNKDADKAAIHRVSGAGAAAAGPRSVWLFARDRQDKDVRQIACLKSNNLKDEEKQSWKFKFASKDVLIKDVPESMPVVEWLGRSTATADELLAKPDPDARAGVRAKNFLKEALAKGPRLSDELFAEANEADISSKTLYRAKGGLKVVHFRQKGKREWYWKLPEPASGELDF